ncbi:asparaginase [Sorangium cellulosum]|uniref:L-asparaginase n=1 Tax=Sorangium cellulosum So0157-2 TaxID=1254432 RepID=S4XVX7_SORCE|nr:asparaginase [Sorangium cellulosum]AGP36654.1 L-asparaginase [Sorangium cellulosum So0157-2]
MPRLHLVTTGGTIASRVDPQTGAAVPAVRAEELVAGVPALGRVAEIAVTELCLESSWNLGPDRIAEVARAARALQADPEVAGVVVTHGTDTLEETAFGLDLLLDGDTPVVLTGAMRDASTAGADGPRNLVSAARVAVAPAARGLGVLVAMNDEIHAARWVMKTHTTAFGTFASPGAGPLGAVDGEGVRVFARPARTPQLPLASPEPRVYLVKVASGMDDLLLRALLDARARGVVIEGSGAGNVCGSWEGAIAALVQAGIPVVLSSRCPGGRVTPTYGAPGGGRRLEGLGVIAAGALSGPKARLALMFALGAGLDAAGLRAYFDRFAG